MRMQYMSIIKNVIIILLVIISIVATFLKESNTQAVIMLLVLGLLLFGLGLYSRQKRQSESLDYAEFYGTLAVIYGFYLIST